MHTTTENKTDKLLMIGDKILIKPKSPSEKTKSGLYLPPGVQEKEQVQKGYVIKTGPGYPMPLQSEDESWKKAGRKNPIHSASGKRR